MHPMATNTKSHIQAGLAHSDCLVFHVTMTGGAIDVRADMRPMPELHVRGLVEPVDATPGNLLALFLVRGYLLDLRLIGSNHQVADHAELYVGNGRIRTRGYSLMTVRALHMVLQMRLMSEGDRLLYIGRIIVGEILRRSQ